MADQLLSAFRNRGLDRPTEMPISTLSLCEAYRVQSLLIERRIAQGEKPVGHKVGCTSRAVRRQFGLKEPVTARLMSPYIYRGNSQLSWDDYVDCAVEAELVFKIGQDVLDLRRYSSPNQIAGVIDSVSAGIEVHNYRFWYGEPTTQELIASNAIHACLVIGNEEIRPEAFDFELEGIGIFIDNELADSAVSAETMGSPLNSLYWLAEELLAHGEYLKAGDLVIPGSAVKLLPVGKGAVVDARFTSCGSVRAEFV